MNAIEQFVAGRTLAIVGVSAAGRGFGHLAYRELKKRGFRLFPVHPSAKTIQGDPCFPRLSELPEKVDRVVVVVKPERAEDVLREAAAAGITNVWLQQGAESRGALQVAAEQGLNLVAGRCILMFTEPVGGVHKFHRFVMKVFRKA